MVTELLAKRSDQMAAKYERDFPGYHKLNDASLHAMPKFLAGFLPIGLMGLLIAAMLGSEPKLSVVSA